MKLNLLLASCLLFTFISCSKNDDDLTKNSKITEIPNKYYLKNDNTFVNSIYDYCLKIKSKTKCSNLEELDFETAYTIITEGGTKIAIISRDNGEFQYFNVYYFSTSQNKIIGVDNEITIQEQMKTKSITDCSNACYQNLKKVVSEHHIIDMIVSVVPFKEFLMGKACYNECKAQV